MKRPFELEWLGGAAERHMRRLRPHVEELPWGTLRASDYPPALVDRARVSWTEASFNEYATARALAQMVGALLEVGAPVDLIGMGSDFIVDEMLHVELTARVAMELGGGAPRQVDFGDLKMSIADASPFLRASELVVRLCCVGEAFSVPMLAGCLRSATHPLVRGVLSRIVHDEGPHGHFGTLYLEWAADRMDEVARAHLANSALDALAKYSPLWRHVRSRVDEHGVTTEGFLLADIHALGWMEAQAYAAAARVAVRDHVLRPLARFGIALDPQRLAELVDGD